MDLLRTLKLADAPAANGSVTIWDDSVALPATTCQLVNPASRYFDSFLLSIYCSHDSSASGLVIQTEMDGTNFRAAASRDGTSFPKTYSAANGKTDYDLYIQGRMHKIAFTISNNSATAFEVQLWGYKRQRASLS